MSSSGKTDYGRIEELEAEVERLRAASPHLAVCHCWESSKLHEDNDELRAERAELRAEVRRLRAAIVAHLVAEGPCSAAEDEAPGCVDIDCTYCRLGDVAGQDRRSKPDE